MNELNSSSLLLLLLVVGSLVYMYKIISVWSKILVARKKNTNFWIRSLLFNLQLRVCVHAIQKLWCG